MKVVGYWKVFSMFFFAILHVCKISQNHKAGKDYFHKSHFTETKMQLFKLHFWWNSQRFLAEIDGVLERKCDFDRNSLRSHFGNLFALLVAQNAARLFEFYCRRSRDSIRPGEKHMDVRKSASNRAHHVCATMDYVATPALHVGSKIPMQQLLRAGKCVWRLAVNVLRLLRRGLGLA